MPPAGRRPARTVGGHSTGGHSPQEPDAVTPGPAAAAADGAPSNGPPSNGPAADDAPSNGPASNGPPSNGPPAERKSSSGPAGNGPASEEPAADAFEVSEEQLGWVIANHVRARRLAIGQSVGQLAIRTGISKGMLSKIENCQTSPSLATLARLASALDMPVTSLFRGLAEERDAVYVKASSGPEIVRQGTRAGHRYQLLGSLRGPNRRIEPLLVSLTERSEVFPLFQHTGVEMLYMLDGVMDYGYGRQRYRMEPGDTLQFEGDIAHGPTDLVELPIRFLSITLYP